jgi:3'-5' exoribonuclease
MSCQLQESERLATECYDFLQIEEGYKKACDLVFGSANEIKDTIVGRVAFELLKQEWSKFSILPAAVSMHHLSTGGLVVHTAGVLSVSLAIADFYNSWYADARINRELLIAGALLHDIGKVTEYDMAQGNTGAVYAGAGILTPHIISGISKVSAMATKLGVIDTPQVQELIHLIASHHGRAEWGSAVEPHSIEADILSNADMIDSTISRRILLNYNEPVGVGKSKRQGSQKFATYVSVPEPSRTEGSEGAANNANNIQQPATAAGTQH